MPKNERRGISEEALRRSPSGERATRFSFFRLLRPRWPALTVALVAGLGETVTGVLDPWRRKVVLDSIIQSTKLPHWLDTIVRSLFGQNKIAILDFAVAAVLAIAVVRAISSYA